MFLLSKDADTLVKGSAYHNKFKTAGGKCSGYYMLGYYRFWDTIANGFNYDNV